MMDSKKMNLMINAFFIKAYGFTSFNPQADKCKYRGDRTEENQGSVALIGIADQTMTINYDGNGNDSYSALLPFCDPLRFLNHNGPLMSIDGYIRTNTVLSCFQWLYFAK